MGATKILLTAEEFDNYPFEEDKRYELDEGELIEMTRPAFDHNDVLMTLQLALGNHLKQTGQGHLLLSENLYALSPSIRRAPDAAVILGTGLAPEGGVEGGALPRDARRNRHTHFAASARLRPSSS